MNSLDELRLADFLQHMLSSLLTPKFRGKPFTTCAIELFTDMFQ